MSQKVIGKIDAALADPRVVVPHEDRFFAYYGLISLYVREAAYLDDPTPTLFAQLEAEASHMPTAHWVHEEVALFKPWSMR
jgi:hypothetical protein